MIRYIAFIMLGAITLGCGGSLRKSEGALDEDNPVKFTVKATGETEPVPRKTNEDAADDPAIWYNRHDPGRSYVIGTDKKGGIAVYDLSGKLVSYYEVGNANNVDVRYDFPLGDTLIDLVAASNRTSRSISIASVSPDGTLDFIDNGQFKTSLSGDVYGFCLYHSPVDSGFYAFMNTKEGEVEQWKLFDNGSGNIAGSVVRSFALEGQTEGMVADDETGNLYIGIETKGIMKFSAEPDSSNKGMLIADSDLERNVMLREDIEGLSIYYAADGKGYLIASSQGNYSYALFRRDGNNDYLMSFRIVDGDSIDGAEETDGLDVINLPLGAYRQGMLVVQDGFNYSNGKIAPQNYKYIPWEDIAIPNGLIVDTTWFPPLHQKTRKKHSCRANGIFMRIASKIFHGKDE